MMSDAKQLTFFAEASLDPASRSPSRASNRASEILDISGLSSSAWLARFGPASSWLRTLVALSGWRSTRVGLTWKVKVTPAGRLYCQLAVSTRRTDATASGLWPSPRATESEMRTYKVTPSQSGGRHGRYLQAEVLAAESERMWPTPQHHDHHPGDPARVGRFGTKHGGRNLNDEAALWPTPRHEGFDAGSHRGSPDSLHAVVKLLPTPMAQAAKHSSPTEYERINRPNDLHVVAAMLPTPTVQDGENTAGPSTFRRNSLPLNAVASEGVTGMKLNPDWVCRMMGFPDDWLNI